jgi:hypothetical protein
MADRLLAGQSFMLLLRDRYWKDVRTLISIAYATHLTLSSVLAAPVDTGNAVSNAIPF